jgi:hypothetical protein
MWRSEPSYPDSNPQLLEMPDPELYLKNTDPHSATLQLMIPEVKLHLPAGVASVERGLVGLCCHFFNLYQMGWKVKL